MQNSPHTTLQFASLEEEFQFLMANSSLCHSETNTPTLGLSHNPEYKFPLPLDHSAQTSDKHKEICESRQLNSKDNQNFKSSETLQLFQQNQKTIQKDRNPLYNNPIIRMRRSISQNDTEKIEESVFKDQEHNTLQKRSTVKHGFCLNHQNQSPQRQAKNFHSCNQLVVDQKIQEIPCQNTKESQYNSKILEKSNDHPITLSNQMSAVTLPSQSHFPNLVQNLQLKKQSKITYSPNQVFRKKLSDEKNTYCCTENIFQPFPTQFNHERKYPSSKKEHYFSRKQSPSRKVESFRNTVDDPMVNAIYLKDKTKQKQCINSMAKMQGIHKKILYKAQLQQRLTNLKIFYGQRIRQQREKRALNDSILVDLLKENQLIHRNKMKSLRNQTVAIQNTQFYGLLEKKEEIYSREFNEKHLQEKIQKAIKYVQKKKDQHQQLLGLVQGSSNRIKEKFIQLADLEKDENTLRDKLESQTKEYLRLNRWAKSIKSVIKKGQQQIQSVLTAHQEEC